jgi:hypothetical protein
MFRVQGFGFRVSGVSGFRVWGLGFGVQGFRVWGSRFQDLEFRVSGFGVQGFGVFDRACVALDAHQKILRIGGGGWISGVTRVVGGVARGVACKKNTPTQTTSFSSVTARHVALHE